MRKIILFFCITGFSHILFAFSEIDSLQNELSKTKFDTSKIDLMLKLSDRLEDTIANEALNFADEAIFLSKKIKDTDRMIRAYMQKGYVLKIQNKYEESIKFYDKAINVTEESNFQKGRALRGLGYLYFENGDNEKALECYIRASIIFEEVNNLDYLLQIQNSIAGVYFNLEQYELALKMIDDIIATAEKLSDEESIIYTLVNKGALYHYLGRHEEAKKAYEKTLNMSVKLNIPLVTLKSYEGIANSLDAMDKNKEAIDLNKKALDMAWKLKEKDKIVQINFNLGINYFNLLQFRNSKYFYERALHLSDSFGVVNILNYESISHCYDSLGQYDKAYKYLKLHYEEYKDEFNEHSSDKILELLEKYKSEQKEKENKILALENENQKGELKTQQYVIYSAFGGGFLLLIIVVQVVISNKKQKALNIEINERNEEILSQNEEITAQRDAIEVQKEDIEKKHKSIQESINYAKRIQNAILPPSNLISEHLPNSFVFYQPKDIVAGDFYWLEYHNDTVFFAAADCTGHGVPGAMVSVVCHNALNRAVREYRLRDTNLILDKVRQIVLTTFEKSEHQVKDGMDICLCAWNKKTNILQFSGANNPLYILRNNAEEIEVIKGDKQPIGYFEGATSFTKEELKLDKGDKLYLFTDGYADQFGGPDDKKLGYRNFRQKLEEASNQPPEVQKVTLDNYFTKWLGKEEQIDDVLVIGIEI